MKYDSQMPPPLVPTVEVQLPAQEFCGKSALDPFTISLLASLVVAIVNYGVQEDIRFHKEFPAEVQAKLDNALAELAAKLLSDDEEGEDTGLIIIVNEDSADEDGLVYEPNNQYPVDGSTGCITASQQKAIQLFSCIEGDNELTGKIGIGTLIMPPPSAAYGAPRECDETIGLDWKSSHGPGVTDPEGPEYWLRGGPMAIDPTEFPNYGLIDPVPPNHIWWVWANSERLNVTPGDPLYQLRTALEDMARSNLQSETTRKTYYGDYLNYLDSLRRDELGSIVETGREAAMTLTGQVKAISNNTLTVNETRLDVSEEILGSTELSVGDYVMVEITVSQGEIDVHNVTLDEER